MENEPKASRQGRENRSLFMYTALIFIAAIVIIIVFSFGQANVMKSQPELPEEPPAEQQLEGIAQKASILSEQNNVLLSQNETLQQQLKEKNEEIDELQTRVDELTINNKNGNIFCNIYQYIQNDKLDDAREALSTINEDALTDAQRIIYNNLETILNL